MTDIEMVKPSELTPYAKNPRRIDDLSVNIVADSIREFGFNQPIVVDGENVIVVGHTRWQAAEKLGLEEVPIVRASWLTEQEARRYRIADNRTRDYSNWDVRKLTEEILSINEDEGETFTGFTEEEVKALTVELDQFEAEAAEETAETELEAADALKDMVEISILVPAKHAAEMKKLCQAVVDQRIAELGEQDDDSDAEADEE